MLKHFAILALATLVAQSCAHKGHGHKDHKEHQEHDHDHGKKDHDHDHDHKHEHGDHDHDHEGSPAHHMHGKASHDHHSGHMHKIEMQSKTDWAIVERVTLKPGESTGAHTGPGRLIVALNDYSIKFAAPGHKTLKKTWKMGDVHWHEAGKHTVTNVGKTVADFLIVFRTGKLKINPAMAKAHDHSKGRKTVFENSWAEVDKVSLKPGQKTPPHSGSYRVIVSLSQYNVNFMGPKGKPHKEFMRFGDVHFHKPGVHAVANTGKTDATFLVINYKK